ncbi:DUF4328 domain-containing protein [Streptomyces sp. NPDC050418]|uniref:DUF4328 domain-containing protein n=1 Tax=Streptomyces sp. NPDC050418 TaxID=3365612 RepID=UPI0037912913
MTGRAPALRSAVGLAWAVSALLGPVIVADLVSAWAGWGLSRVWQEDLETLSGEASRAYTLLMLPTMAAFLVWFWRVRVNAEVLAADAHSRSRGWAFWGWFVPVVNFWFPYRMALDIWNAGRGSRLRSAAVVHAWWLTFTLSRAVFAYRRWAIPGSAGERSPENEKFFLELGAAADTAEAVAAVLAIVFVWRVTKMQRERGRPGACQDAPFVPTP